MARRNHHIQRWGWGSRSESSGDPGRASREQPDELPGHTADFQIPGPPSPSAGEGAAGCSFRTSKLHKPKCSSLHWLPVKIRIYQERHRRRSLIHSSILCFLLKEQIKLLEEEIQSLEESELSLSSYSDWYSSTHKNFKNVAAKIDKVDIVVMGKKMKALEVGTHTSGLSPHLTFIELLRSHARCREHMFSFLPGMVFGSSFSFSF